jgi:hypothetical protein
VLEDLLEEAEGAKFWRATDRTLARDVGVHVLAGSDRRADALLTAARTSALVTDPHLLRVLDAARVDDVVYVVNEWGAGVSLDRLLADGPLDARRAAWVAKEVAEAIATAHRNGVAHGRLLPETVVITDAGSVKLVGFVVDAVLRGREHHRVTGGEAVSAHEADVINLAGLLYAGLVGRWPGTEGSSIPAAPTEHGRPMRPRQVRAGVPRPLDAICDRVLNADAHPGALPPLTAHEIWAALSDYIGDAPGTAPQQGFEATALLQTGELAALVGGMGADDPGESDGAAGQAPPHGPETADLPATGAMAPVDEPADHPAAADEEAPDGEDPATERTPADPEATQAAAPVFEDSGEHTVAAAPPWGGPGWSGDDEAEARPLFADGPTRRTPPERAGQAADDRSGPGRNEDSGSFLGGFSGTGGWSGERQPARTPTVPPAWGPDADRADDDWDEDWDGDEDTGRSWLRLAAAIAGIVVLVIALVFAFDLGRGPADDNQQGAGPSPSPSTKAPVSRPVHIAAVNDFDPEGDPPEENPDLTDLAIDGRPGTAWQTLTYQGNPRLGGLKSGVGLLVDLGHKARVGDVRLTLLGSGTSLQLLAAPDAVAAPADTDGLDQVAAARNVGTKVDLRLDRPVRTRWLVVWLTKLPPFPGGYKGQVAEISVRS